jgi:hypothetical protein
VLIDGLPNDVPEELAPVDIEAYAESAGLVFEPDEEEAFLNPESARE